MRRANDMPQDAFPGKVASTGEEWRKRERLAAGLAPTPIRGIVPAPSALMLRGRGARSCHAGRHERHGREAVDDGWDSLARLATERLRTQVREERARSIITRNSAPDVGFSHSVNPYRGCEHGCIYCYARAGHADLGLSPGLDFESRIVAKVNAAQLLEQALRRPSWRGEPLALGTCTDVYQPVERQLRITRRLLEVAERHRQPLTIITKSRLVLRDLDILRRMARRRLVRVAVSITTLQPDLARAMEPRACAPARRLDTIGQLADAGVPVAVMMAPVVPGLNDHEIEAILLRARQAGARDAAMTMLRLPPEVAELFGEWLQDHHPRRARRILEMVAHMHGGKLNDGRFGRRMTGSGPQAWLLWRRYEITCRRLGLGTRPAPLDSSHFIRHPDDGRQPRLPLPDPD